MASAAPSAHPGSPPSQPAIPVTPGSPPNKRDLNLKSWWKSFRLPKNQEQQEPKGQGIFGVPLRQSITYANVAISLDDGNGKSYIYGYVPIVVAKCGVFLKEKATGIEGIFRLSGSEKRIKELKTAFDSPDRYGKGLVWDGYTVHDAANVFRRYLNDLPEPVVPLDLYEKFRDPLRGATKQAVGDAEGPQFVENFDEKAAIETYQRLITELPPLNRQLLLYILDLLAVFAAKSEENRMTSQNLAAIFQPGMLSHPNHAMAPEEYRLNQCVIIFLIENQDHFLIGMQGTAADEKTKKEVESGTTPTGSPVTPTGNRRSGVGVGRSSSNASAGAHSVRRDGQIRRNRSVASRSSKKDGSTTPGSPALNPTQTGGLGRSNTVPSKRSPAIQGGKFRRHENSSGAHSPAHLEPLTPVHPSSTPRISEQSSLAPVPSAQMGFVPGPSQERLLGVPQDQVTPSKERNLQGMFQRSPTDESRRQPNKLKKKRIPSSMNPSAQSSNASLPHPAGAVSPSTEPPNPMDQAVAQYPEGEQPQVQPSIAQISDRPAEPTAPTPTGAGSTLHPDRTLKSQKSPPTSLHSSFNEASDAEHGPESQLSGSNDSKDKETKRRFRLSRLGRDGESAPRASSSDRHTRSNDQANASQTSFSSATGTAQKPRMSFTETTDATMVSSSDTHNLKDDSYKEDSKGPIGWIRNKYREAKETAEQRRAKSPSGDHTHGHSHSLGLRSRGKSINKEQEAEKRDVPRETHTEGKQHIPQGSTVLGEMEKIPETKPEQPAASLDSPVAAAPTTVAAPAAQAAEAPPPAEPLPATAQTEVRTEVQPEIQPEVQPEVQPEIQAEVQPEVQPEVHSTTEPEPRSEVQTETQSQTQPEVKTEPHLEAPKA